MKAEINATGQVSEEASPQMEGCCLHKTFQEPGEQDYLVLDIIEGKWTQQDWTVIEIKELKYN